MHFIVKLFPEITIKSPPVRKRFIKQLRNNLRLLLRKLDPDIEVRRDWEKIEVLRPEARPGLQQQVAEILARVPGIANFSATVSHPLSGKEDDKDRILNQTLAVWREALAGKTFCVRVKRTGDHDFTSVDLERYVGGGLNQQTQAAGVKLKNPDVEVKLEVRQDTLYILEDKRPGLGGFPLGTQDPILSLVSGGFDSTVASYLTIKRGVRTHYCFFNLGGREHELGVKEVAFYLWNKYGVSHGVKFVTVPFEAVVREILENVDNSLMGVVLKRMMLRAASRVASYMGIEALVTGEAIAQVSSQTLRNLAVIDQVTDTLVLRPLVTMDKSDIIDIARRIGTEDFAAHMPEYCGVISRKPTTRARIERVQATESRFDFNVLEWAIDNRQTLDIDQVVLESRTSSKPLDVSILPAGAIVVDIRHPDEEELTPLVLEGHGVEKIPFYRLNSAASRFDKEKTYFLYCDKGVMSQLHAAHLNDSGVKNVGVYRPELAKSNVSDGGN